MLLLDTFCRQFAAEIDCLPAMRYNYIIMFISLQVFLFIFISESAHFLSIKIEQNAIDKSCGLIV
jgi:hypothetical protein